MNDTIVSVLDIEQYGFREQKRINKFRNAVSVKTSRIEDFLLEPGSPSTFSLDQDGLLIIHVHDNVLIRLSENENTPGQNIPSMQSQINGTFMFPFVKLTDKNLHVELSLDAPGNLSMRLVEGTKKDILVTDTTYSYTVTAVTSTRETGSSNVVSGSAKDNMVYELTWDAFPGAERYNVYRRTADTEFLRIASIDAVDNPMYTDNGRKASGMLSPDNVKVQVHVITIEE